MRHYIFCIFLLTAIGTQAQQVNPVPDYVFRNQMSVGRNAVTDTAAYMSIGPRYGANKGLMPPIVSDTAAITGVKRNGLLIFSVQRNNFQYWDSINSRWTSVTANVDTTVISTRAWRKKGDDSLGAVIATKVNISDTATMLNPYTRGSGTVNYVPKFTTTRAFGNSQIFDNGTNVGINTSTPVNIGSAVGLTINGSGASFLQLQRSGVNALQIGADASGSDMYEQRTGYMRFGTSNTERLRIFANGRVGINTTTDAGYQFDVNGTMRTVNGAIFASDGSGRVGIRNTNPQQALDVTGSILSSIANNQTNFISPTGNGTLRIADDVSSGTRKEFTIILDNTNNRVDIQAIQQGVAVRPITLNATGGNIGIGTTSPSESLDVNGRIRARTIDSTSSPINILTSDVNGVIRKTAPGVQGSGTTNYVAKFTASGTVGNSQIFDDGTNVGIGIITPSFKLDVSGNINGNNVIRNRNTNSGSSATSLIWLGNDASATLGAMYVTSSTNTSGAGANSLNLYTAGANPIGFATNNNQRMLLTSDGELLINTTTDAGDFRLQVNGNANFRDDVLIDTNLRVNRHISLDQTPKAWALGNAIEGPQGSTLFVAGGGVQTLANIYYDGSYKYSTSNPGAAMFLLQSGITFATYGSGTANGALTGANEMVYAGGELRVGLADQGTFKLQVADKSYFGDEVQIASTTDLGNYKLQVTGEAIITAGIRTDAPSGGTAATWKLGTVATVSPTSPNRTIEVEIGGTTYYIHAKTTND